MTPFNPRLSHAYRELAHAATETAKTAWRRRLDEIWRDIYAQQVPCAAAAL